MTHNHGNTLTTCDVIAHRHFQLWNGFTSGQTAQLASLVLAAAETRTESRGTHQRSDYPSTDPDQALRRSMRVAFAASATPLTTTPIWANAAKEPHPC